MRLKAQAKKVANDWTGSCDNCGKDLSDKKWIIGESTGCTYRCAMEDFEVDLRETSAQYSEDAENA